VMLYQAHDRLMVATDCRRCETSVGEPIKIYRAISPAIKLSTEIAGGPTIIRKYSVLPRSGYFPQLPSEYKRELIRRSSEHEQ
jgi:hypothetical protein